MRWLLTFILASIVLSALWPALERWLKRVGIGRMPGDFSFRVFGRNWFFPLGSALLFSLIFWLIARVM